MPMAKVEAFNSPEAMKPEQKVVKQEKEEHDSIDHFIKQAVSFSRPTENPVQWIQLLQALDQQGSNKAFNGSKVDNYLEGKEQSLDPYNGVSICHSAVNGFKESVHSLKGNGISAKGTKSTYEQMQALKIPEAVVAFAQAAAKANGEPEKYLPGWPLLSPSKVQLQRCDKCSREFCSPINYRRHIRVHRRSLNIDKDFPKNRVLLGAFWDKLSVDEAIEIVSFKDVVIEETTGASIIKALTSLIRKPGFSSLPHMYLKAGSTLLDIVQGKPSIFPISFQEFFSVLDDASEKTFLCAGTAVSMQKFVFDGEAGKMALEMRNLVACTSFLLEQKLVKAWLADKDAEALRYQKLLVEEEEAARQRQADLVERKRLKKLRQKEQRAKEYSENKSDLKTGSSDNLERTPSPGARSETELQTPESPNMRPIILETTSSLHVDAGPSPGQDLHAESAAKNSENGIQMGAQSAHTSSACQLVMKPSRNVPNGFHLGQISEAKSSAFLKHGNLRDPKAVALGHGHKIWTRKTKSNEEEGTMDSDKSHRECKGRSEMFEKSVVLIGSISVTLGGNNASKQDALSLKWNHPEEKLAKPDSCMNHSNRFLVKQWRPVGRNDNGNSSTAQICKGDTKLEVFPAESTTQVEFDESSFASCHSDANGELSPDESCLSSGDSYAQLPVDERSCSSGGADTNHSDQRHNDLLIVNVSQVRPFSSHIAEAFLTQRWKEAMASEHVKLVLYPETEALENLDAPRSGFAEALVKASNCRERTILGNAENRVDGAASLCTGALKTKFRAKPEKNYRIKYVPKQTNNG